MLANPGLGKAVSVGGVGSSACAIDAVLRFFAGSGRQIEVPAMARADDLAVDEFAFGEVGAGLRSESLNFPNLTVDLARESIGGAIAATEFRLCDGLQRRVFGHFEECEQVLVVLVGVTMRLEAQR